MSKPKPATVKFHLVHRSERDPLIIDDAASKFVLQEVSTAQNLHRRERRRAQSKATKAKAEGLLFDLVESEIDEDDDDDDHEFLGEEMTVDEGSFRRGLLLPTAALPSLYEESTGVLERDELHTGAIMNAPHDVREALLGRSDDEFDELEDDFMQQAMESCSDYSGEETDLDTDLEDFGKDPMLMRIDESDSEGDDDGLWEDAVVRPGALGDIDTAFETLILQYDSEEIGELGDDVQGVLESVDDGLLDEFIVKAETKYIPGPNISKDADLTIDLTRKLVLKQLDEEANYDTDDDNRALERECQPTEREQWDCESILSTLTNVENHPTLILEPRKIRLTRRGIPEDDDEVKKTPLEPVVEGVRLNLGAPRAKGETSEEKAARKAAVRFSRQERRVTKKEMRQAFNKEECTQHVSSIVQRRQNPPAVKL